MALNAGELTQRIQFQREVTVKNDFGEEVGTDWLPVTEIGGDGQVWAKRTNQLSATAEAVASGAESYREQVRFDIRPRDIDPAWRIVHRGRIFDIKSAGTSNDGSETAIIAVAGLSNG
ncbi:MAG TPA: head-tail adaptor protein [Luteimonas sp.]